jgi:hypothetical protein
MIDAQPNANPAPPHCFRNAAALSPTRNLLGLFPGTFVLCFSTHQGIFPNSTHMDPLTALGLVCNVLDLVGKAIKCGKTVYKLYKDGFTEDQEDLESVAGTLESVVTGLQKAPNNANIRKSAMDPQIVKLLTESTKLCVELRDLVKKCKTATSMTTTSTTTSTTTTSSTATSSAAALSTTTTSTISRPKTSSSWRAAGVAALKKLVHKSDIESLEKKLEICRINLIAVLSAATQ